MVFTRCQACNNNTSERERMCDNKSDVSFPEVLTREQMTDFDSNDILNRQNIAERNPIDQRFYEMNRQIGEITDLVLALTQQISANQREGNELNTVTTNANSRSDSWFSTEYEWEVFVSSCHNIDQIFLIFDPDQTRYFVFTRTFPVEQNL